MSVAPSHMAHQQCSCALLQGQSVPPVCNHPANLFPLFTPQQIAELKRTSSDENYITGDPNGRRLPAGIIFLNRRAPPPSSRERDSHVFIVLEWMRALPSMWDWESEAQILQNVINQRMVKVYEPFYPIVRSAYISCLHGRYDKELTSQREGNGQYRYRGMVEVHLESAHTMIRDLKDGRMLDVPDTAAVQKICCVSYDYYVLEVRLLWSPPTVKPQRISLRWTVEAVSRIEDLRVNNFGPPPSATEQCTCALLPGQTFPPKCNHPPGLFPIVPAIPNSPNLDGSSSFSIALPPEFRDINMQPFPRAPSRRHTFIVMEWSRILPFAWSFAQDNITLRRILNEHIERTYNCANSVATVYVSCLYNRSPEIAADGSSQGSCTSRCLVEIRSDYAQRLVQDVFAGNVTALGGAV